jgi:hypothetical protein
MDGKFMVAVVAALGLVSKLSVAQAPAPSATAPGEPPAAEAPAPNAEPPEAAPPPTEPESESEPEPAPKKRSAKARVKWADPDAEAPAEDEEAERETRAEAEPPSERLLGWRLGGSHFVLSFERMATLLSWRQAVKFETQSSSLASATSEVAMSGTDASLLVAGTGRTASAVPRIAFDGIVDGGFTFGGSLGYQSSTGKQEATATAAEADLATTSVFVFGARLGYFAVTSDTIGIWLRGGFTRTSISAESTSTSNGVSATTTLTQGAWNFSLDPQLVLVAAPHVGITLGPLLDIPLEGTIKSTAADGQAVERDYSSSAYGVTAGATAIF